MSPAFKAHQTQHGALFLVSSLMIGSALLRFGVGVGPAVSGEMSRQLEKELPVTENPAPRQRDRDELQLVITALQEKEEQLKLRESQLADRFKALEVADSAIERKLAALEDAEIKLSATLTLADGASEQDLSRLTSVYEKMKPKETAALFATMDPVFAAGFLTRMRPEAAAAILAGLAPEAAYTISVVLAGRNATVPKQ